MKLLNKIRDFIENNLGLVLGVSIIIYTLNIIKGVFAGGFSFGVASMFIIFNKEITKINRRKK